MTALAAKIATVSRILIINTDRVLLATSDFRDHELPAVQIWDIAQSPEHQRGRILVTWSISVEIIMKSLEAGAVQQSDLWELRRKVQLANSPPAPSRKNVKSFYGVTRNIHPAC